MGEDVMSVVRLAVTGYGSGAGHDKIAHSDSATKGNS
jgi:hypothetical protein